MDKEENFKVLDVIMQWLTAGDEVALNSIDADDPDIADYQHLPNIAQLAEQPRVCLQDGEEVGCDGCLSSASHPGVALVPTRRRANNTHPPPPTLD